MDKQTNGQKGNGKNKQKTNREWKKIGKQTKRLIQIDRQMDQMDKRTNGQMGKWTNGQMEEPVGLIYRLTNK